MSRKGNPYDNAFADSFIKTLKVEEVYLDEYETFEDALRNIWHFIENVYNKKRLHSALGYRSPDKSEMEVAFPCKSKIMRSKHFGFHLLRMSPRPEAHGGLNTVA